MIAIVDYGMGNSGSLENIIKKAGGRAVITADRDRILQAEKLVFPGVGAFDTAVTSLQKSGLRDVLEKRVREDRVPILCICLGAQLITGGSEEGRLPGLGWISGRTVRFSFNGGSQLKVPHMGWNTLVLQKPSRLLRDMYEEPRFYFVHSYHIVCDDPADVLAKSCYGYEFVSALERGNIYATQFHPEKSHKYGLRLIRNFVEL